MEADAEFESEVLISVSGELNGDVNKLAIEEVEIVNPITSIHFGTLELDYAEYE